MAITMLKIRRPNGRLIFNMEIAILRLIRSLYWDGALIDSYHIKELTYDSKTNKQTNQEKTNTQTKNSVANNDNNAKYGNVKLHQYFKDSYLWTLWG